MEYLEIMIQAPVDVNLKTNTLVNTVPGIDGTHFVAINLTHGMCCIYQEQIDIDGNKMPYHMGQYAFRETDHGIQYYDYNWKFFDEMTQELWFGYKAEQELLEK